MSATPREADRSSANEPALPDELTIQGLPAKATSSTPMASLVGGLFMIVSMIVVLGAVIWHRLAPGEAPQSKPLAVAADQLPPIRFDTRLDTTQARSASQAASAPITPDAGTVSGPTAPGPGPLPGLTGSIGGGSPASPSASPIPLRQPGPPQPVMPVVPGIDPRAGGTIIAGSGGTAPRRDDSPFVTPWPGTPASGRHSGDLPARNPDPQRTGAPLATATANLDHYQSQLDGMVRQLQALTDQTLGTAGRGSPAGLAVPAPLTPPAAPAPTSNATRAPALFGQLERTSTPRAQASMIGARSFLVPKGVLFQCALKTRVVSAVSGFVGCQVQRPVYSDDGKVVLIERGSHLDGEYRIAHVRPGVTRIPILWTRVRTPHGVTIDLDSSATGPLGDSGAPGEVNNRWMERIGAALLLSLIDDAIRLQISENTAHAGTSGGSTVVLPNTAATTSRLAEKVLDSTINIPPLISIEPGAVVSVYVSRDLDFSSVYRLDLSSR